jgi:peptidoglycan/xylan/chitin deacetylase (PgdA/CDA1 family)
MTQHAVKFTAATVDRLLAARAGAVILIYHRVGRRTTLEVDLPASLFDEQMAALAQLGQVTTLDAALEWMCPTEPSPKTTAKPPIVVTFDDGTDDLVDIAMPILERHAIPATLYVATDFIDRAISFPANGRPLSWAALGEMVSTGLITVGSHTHTHALLDRLAPNDAANEIATSSRLIEEHVGYSPAHFAYPKAVAPSSTVDRMIRDNYRSAALAGTRPNRQGYTDAHLLARSPIQVGDGMRWFEHKVAGGMAFEDDLRRTANRWRYANATK